MDKKDYENKLITLLANMNFATHYYSTYETFKGKQPSTKFEVNDYLEAINAVSEMPFKYYKKEKFFGIREKWGELVVKFNIALYHNCAIEFILAVQTPAGFVGGPFPRLANLAAKLNQPDFSYTPRFPRLPFSTKEELRQVMQFGVEIYEETKNAAQDTPDLFQ